MGNKKNKITKVQKLATQSELVPFENCIRYYRQFSLYRTLSVSSDIRQINESTGLLNHLIIESFDYWIIWLLNHLIIESFDYWIIWLLNHLIIESFDYWIIWLLNHLIIESFAHELQNFHLFGINICAN